MLLDRTRREDKVKGGCGRGERKSWASASFSMMPDSHDSRKSVLVYCKAIPG